MKKAHIKLAGIEEYLDLHGIVKQHNRTMDRRVEWKVACRGENCAETLLLHWGPGAPPEVIVNDVKRKGWLIERGERPLCPSCQRAITRKAKDLGKAKKLKLVPPLVSIEKLNEAALEVSRMFNIEVPALLEGRDETPSPEEQEPPVMNAVQTPPPIVNEMQVSPRIARLLHELLGEFFDEKNGAYRHGYSDERIAQEVGCHVGVVARTRGEGYGDLTEDTRISALREDMIKFERALEKVEKTARADIEALRSRLEQIAQTTKSR